MPGLSLDHRSIIPSASRRLLLPWLLSGLFAVTGSMAGLANGNAKLQRKSPAQDLKLHDGLQPRLRSALLDILADPVLDGADVSFMAVRLSDGAVLAEHRADTLINPASNAKLITAAAALHYLKPEFRFRTEYYVHGSLRNGVLDGDLIIRGLGDPTVVTERLQRVANELYLFGVEQITGSVVVDDSYFDPQLEPRGWELEEAADRAYAAPVSALSFNYNAIAVYLRPGARGQPALIRLDPEVEAVTLQADVPTRRFTRRLKVHSESTDAGTLVQVTGTIGHRQSPRRIYRRIYDPPAYFGSALTAFLQRRGTKMRHRVVRGKVPPRAKLIYVDQSPALTEVVSDLNHYSNNFIAETLIKTLSAEAHRGKKPGTFEEGLQLARAFVRDKVGIEERDYVFGNGSGLNDVNRLSARQVVKLLDVMQRDFEIGHEFINSLAVAGTQGTIGHRMRKSAAERRLRAKTGTLRGVSALSGYVVDPDGERIAFSFLTQHYRGAVSSVWNVQNRIGEALASAGDSFIPTPNGGVVGQRTQGETKLPAREMSPGGDP